MKTRYKILIIIASLILLRLVYNGFFTTGMMEGTYVSQDHTHSFRAEVPYRVDTLVLKPGGKFSSNYYGNGTYELEYAWRGTTLELTYKYELGIAGVSLYIDRDWFSSPKVMQDSDLNYYYEKIK
jgi:hypothetical protein